MKRFILVLFLFQSFMLNAADDVYLAVLDKLKFSPSAHEVTEEEEKFCVETDEKIFMLLKGQLYDNHLVEARENVNPQSCLELLELMFFYCKNDVSKVDGLYDSESQDGNAELPAETSQKINEMLQKISSIKLLNEFRIAEDYCIVFTSITLEGEEGEAYIPWQFIIKEDKLYIKSGVVDMKCFSDIMTALYQGAVTFHKNFVTIEPVNVNQPVGTPLDLTAKVYGGETPTTFNWKVNEQESNDVASRNFLWDTQGEHLISATTADSNVFMPAKIRVLAIEKIQKVIEAEKFEDLKDELGNIQRNITNAKVEDISAGEITMLIGETLNLRVLSNAKNIWPKNAPVWKQIDMDNKVVQTVESSEFSFTAEAVGEYELEIRCGSSVKRLTLIIEDPVSAP